MTEITKIDVLKIDTAHQTKKSLKSNTEAKAGFEDQLLQTVKKLENMGNEIEAMMESSIVPTKANQRPEQPTKHVVLNSVESIVETFSDTTRTTVKSAKNVAAEYQAMNQKKHS